MQATTISSTDVKGLSYTRLLKLPQKKKLKQVKSGERASQGIGLPHPIQCWPQRASRGLLTFQLKLSRASSCWNHIFLLRAGKTSTRSSRKTFCRNMLHVWPVKLLDKMYCSTKLLSCSNINGFAFLIGACYYAIWVIMNIQVRIIDVKHTRARKGTLISE